MAILHMRIDHILAIPWLGAEFRPTVLANYFNNLRNIKGLFTIMLGQLVSVDEAKAADSALVREKGCLFATRSLRVRTSFLW